MTWMFQRSRHLLTCESNLLETWTLALCGEKKFDTQDGVWFDIYDPGGFRFDCQFLTYRGSELISNACDINLYSKRSSRLDMLADPVQILAWLAVIMKATLPCKGNMAPKTPRLTISQYVIIREAKHPPDRYTLSPA